MVKQFHIGPRKCGKSAFVEQMMISIFDKLYVGTLSDRITYDETIKEHVVRRGSNWQLYEVTDDFNLDLRQLAKIAGNNISAIMLDGISTWYAHVKVTTPELTINMFTNAIADLIRSTGIDWYLVDALIDDSTAQKLQLALIETLNIKEIINWNYE